MRLHSRGVILLVVFLSSCDLSAPDLVGLPVETRFAFVNFSTRHYAALAVREHVEGSDDALFVPTPLLAPGVIFRADFTDLLGTGCPGSLDLRVVLYRRVNEDIPIGDDAGEAVDASPIAAGSIESIPACNVAAVVTYTIVNWDAPDGTARVKIAQGSAVETAIRNAGLFPNVDAAWEIDGVEGALADIAPPIHAPIEPIAGRVTLTDGSGVAGVGVLLRSRFRTRLDDADASNDPDAGYSDPIAFTLTGADGSFAIDRPAGGYRIEFFSDDFLFRPAIMDLETPIEAIQVIAEPQ